MRHQRNGRALRGRRCRPHVEALEVRCCPSITTMFDNGVLTIEGDRAFDSVSIVADGDEITVKAGRVDETFEDVTTIELDLGSGRDRATIDLSDADDVDLGDDDDDDDDGDDD
jgi:hypothetical protein